MRRLTLILVVLLCFIFAAPFTAQAANTPSSLASKAAVCATLSSGTATTNTNYPVALTVGKQYSLHGFNGDPTDNIALQVTDSTSNTVGFVMSVGDAVLSFTVPANGIYDITVAYFGGGDYGIYPISYTLTEICGGTSGGGTSPFTDTRINQTADQPISVYYDPQHDGSGGLRVYIILNSKGYYSFTVTPAEIAAVPEHPAVNTLIKSVNGIRVYRLTTGELQINALKPDGTDYVTIFPAP
jgi:hypothetical protein